MARYHNGLTVLRDSPTMLRCTKRASGASRTPALPRSTSASMTAALPAVLDYPFAGAARARRRASRSRRGVQWLRMPLPFALDHINLWLLDDGGRLDAGRLRLRRRRRRARCGSSISRRRSRAGRSRASSRRTTTPTTSATPPGSRSASAAPVAMTHAEYLTAHAIAGEHSGSQRRRDASTLFRRHGMAAEHVDALAARGNRYRRGVPELPAVVRAAARRRRRRASAARDVARDRGLRPFARARVAVLRGARAC